MVAFSWSFKSWNSLYTAIELNMFYIKWNIHLTWKISWLFLLEYLLSFRTSSTILRYIYTYIYCIHAYTHTPFCYRIQNDLLVWNMFILKITWKSMIDGKAEIGNVVISHLSSPMNLFIVAFLCSLEVTEPTKKHLFAVWTKEQQYYSMLFCLFV